MHPIEEIFNSIMKKRIAAIIQGLCDEEIRDTKISYIWALSLICSSQ